MAPGRNSPSSTFPLAASSFRSASTVDRPRPYRSATSVLVNGAWVARTAAQDPARRGARPRDALLAVPLAAAHRGRPDTCSRTRPGLSWLAAQRDRDRASRLRQFVSRPPPVDVGARVDLIERQIAEPKQEIVHAVDGPWHAGPRAGAEARPRPPPCGPRRAAHATRISPSSSRSCA